LGCRLGLHKWYFDSAWFSTVERCNFCHRVSDEQDAATVEMERELWKRCAEDGLSFDDSLPVVARGLLDKKIGKT
jgi:hypothetical protein